MDSRQRLFSVKFLSLFLQNKRARTGNFKVPVLKQQQSSGGGGGQLILFF